MSWSRSTSYEQYAGIGDKIDLNFPMAEEKENQKTINVHVVLEVVYRESLQIGLHLILPHFLHDLIIRQECPVRISAVATGILQCIMLS